MSPQPVRSIRPLGEQIIIKTFPPESVGSIILPDSAKRATMMGEGGAQTAVHYVEAEVIAVGPGRRMKGDPELALDLANALEASLRFAGTSSAIRFSEIEPLLERAFNPATRYPLSVKPGDRILYHPAVQSFDRKVEGLGEGEFYIIREESVLAIIERNGEAR